jgi:hypothetical protein
MVPDQAGAAPGMPESRTGAFDVGLNQDSVRFQAKVPSGVVQSSVLQPYRPSDNGMSAQDYQRVLPGGMILPTANGSSAATYEKAAFMRLQGQSNEI